MLAVRAFSSQHMIETWQALPLAQQIFSGMTIGFGGLLLLMLLEALIGADTDADAGGDADVDLDSSGAFSVKGVLSFLTFFGGGGWLALRAGAPLWLAVLVAALCGYAVMSTLIFMLAKLRGLDVDGGRRSLDLLGQDAEVYLHIPANGSGIGRIHIRQHNRLVELEAESTGAAIANGARVRVVELVGHHRVQVEPVPLLDADTGSTTFSEPSSGSPST